MRVLQALPALHSGGVERGTVEFAAELVKRGHESFVVSNGGPMAEQVRGQGSTHIHMPIHRKSPSSFGQILPMRRLIQTLRPDIIHVRSRMPAWIIHLALKTVPEHERPALVSTFHGMYSVNPYSAVMAKADEVIAISNYAKAYVQSNFHVPENRISVIQRGVDIDAFRDHSLNEQWRQQLLKRYPQLANKKIIMMPGRISRMKGQVDFLRVMQRIIRQRSDCHGVIVGGAEPKKEHFLQELESERTRLKLTDAVSFLGPRSDIANLYLFSSIVCHLSTKPEPFGRTVPEALASGTPVVAYNHGGAAETLRACFPEGLVPPGDTEAFATAILNLLDQPKPALELPERFWLTSQTEATLAVYERAIRRVQA